MAQELYVFKTTFGSYRYTDGRRARTVQTLTYTPAPIKRGEIERSIEDNVLQLRVPDTLNPVPTFLPSIMATHIDVEIFEYLNSTTLGNRKLSGRMTGLYFEVDKREAVLSVLGIGRMLKAVIPNRTFASHCQHDLFDNRCKLLPENFRVSFPWANATFGSPLTVTHSALGAYPDGRFVGGFASIGSEFAYIIKHVGNTIWLINRFAAFTNDTMHVHFGCPKTASACENLFSNKVNFGGAEFAPRDNPVTGTLL